MTKQHQDQFNTAVISNDQVPFDERGFTIQQTRQILAVGKTRFFEHILPELQSYLEGTRRIVMGRSIRAYRERRLAEPPAKRATYKPTKKRRNRTSGAAP
jgi:hypothetical protein